MSTHQRFLTVFLVISIALAACGGDDGGGGDDDGGVDPLTLVESLPADGGSLFTGEPIELVFSAALDPATVTTAVTLGGATAYDVALADDGVTVLVTLTEVPALPAAIEVDIGASLRSVDGAAFVGATLGLTAPLWHSIDEADQEFADLADPHLAALGEDVWILVAAPAVEHVVLGRRVRGQWQAELTLDGDAAYDLIPAGADLLLAWRDLDGVAHVGRYADAALTELSLGVAGVTAVDLAASAGGVVVAAAITADDLELVELGRAATPRGNLAGGSGIIAFDGETLVILARTAEGLGLYRLDGDGPAAVGGVLDPDGVPAGLAAESGGVRLAWLSGPAEPGPRDARTALLATDAEAVSQGVTLDLNIAGDVRKVALASDPSGSYVAWSEAVAELDERVYVARVSESGVAHLGGRIASDTGFFGPFKLGLTIDAAGWPVVGWYEPSDIPTSLQTSRWNRSPSLPAALPTVGGAGCELADPPPDTLSATGCYADLAARTLQPGFAPYGLRTELWSDGADKRRAVYLPAGTAMGYVATGALVMPVGAIVAKEFALGATIMETRFFVKRCEEGDCLESWQGYSYVWNPAGTEANRQVDDGTITVDWPLPGGGSHTHSYPSSFECVTCHKAVSGRVLGLQAAQLAGRLDYGEVVVPQLGALAAAGYLGDAPDPETLLAVTPLPRTLDASYPMVDRARAYLHANCSHCHQPGGGPPMDFRFQTALADTGLCDRVTPGDHLASTLFVRDSTRGPGQMPPLATLVVDDGWLALLAAWIDGLAACP